MQRTNRAVVTYKPEGEVVGKGLRLFIKDGIIQNPEVDARIILGIQESNLAATKVRVTGMATRFLVRDVIEEELQA